MGARFRRHHGLGWRQVVTWRRGLQAALALSSLLAAARGSAQIESQPDWRDVQEAERKRREQKGPPRLTKPPKLTYQVPPVYPDAARKERRQGTTVLRLTIDEEGY